MCALRILQTSPRNRACCTCHPLQTLVDAKKISVYAQCCGCCRYQGLAAAVLARSMGIKNMGMVYEDASYGYGESPRWCHMCTAKQRGHREHVLIRLHWVSKVASGGLSTFQWCLCFSVQTSCPYRDHVAQHTRPESIMLDGEKCVVNVTYACVVTPVQALPSTSSPPSLQMGALCLWCMCSRRAQHTWAQMPRMQSPRWWQARQTRPPRFRACTSVPTTSPSSQVGYPEPGALLRQPSCLLSAAWYHLAMQDGTTMQLECLM